VVFINSLWMLKITRRFETDEQEGKKAHYAGVVERCIVLVVGCFGLLLIASFFRLLLATVYECDDGGSNGCEQRGQTGSVFTVNNTPKPYANG
jgi:hypothetical protein